MRIPLDRNLPQPLYQQIYTFLREQIESGVLAPGAQLPATRQLAKDLGVSRITVQNAYLDLESEALITTREGSGTYVRVPLYPVRAEEPTASTNWPQWQQPFVSDTQIEPWGTLPPQKEMISFTGVGAVEQFPIVHFGKAFKTVTNYMGEEAYQYGAFDGGYLPLRETIGEILASQGIRARPEHILVCSGSQQALSLVCQVLLRPGDIVLAEQPTYNLALDLFRMLRVKVVGVPIDADGMQVTEMEGLINQHQPRLIYTVPNFQNPSGMCLSAERRRQLIDLVDRYQIPLIEDDFVGDLRFAGRSLPAIKALDPGGRVLYVGTFSKMLMPGLRMGYLVAEGPVYKRLAHMKMVTDLTSSPVMQRTLHEFVTVGRYQIHLRRSKKLYRKRSDAMLKALTEYLPQAEVIPPQGGLFIWLQLPEGVNTREMLSAAREAGVEYAPGDQFFSNPEDGACYLRLNFAVLDEAQIVEGVRRLAGVWINADAQ
jgi:GntR family transcriptional regulator/MocR family aminotransferase